MKTWLCIEKLKGKAVNNGQVLNYFHRKGIVKTIAMELDLVQYYLSQQDEIVIARATVMIKSEEITNPS